jgi:hypothetical protein
MNRVLADTIDAHGGLERWKRLVTVETHVGGGGELHRIEATVKGRHFIQQDLGREIARHIKTWFQASRTPGMCLIDICPATNLL